MYKARIDAVDSKEEIKGEGVPLSSLETVEAGLLRFRAQLENVLQTVARVLASLKDEQSATKRKLKENLMAQYEYMKEAVECEDVYYIASRLSRPDLEEASESNKQLAEALNKAMEEVMQMRQLAELDELLNSFYSRSNFPKFLYGLQAEGKYVYGVCYLQDYGNMTFCRYDIKNRRMTPVFDKYYNSMVVQIAQRIFLCGGYETFERCTGTLNEFIEKSKTLIFRSPMRYAKYHHRAQVINSKVFVTIGGKCGNNWYENIIIPHCEEYSIDNNKWNMLPSMQHARFMPGSAFLKGRFLYAIGGCKAGNSIEALDFNDNKKRSRELLMLESRELEFTDNMLAIPVSDNEILILSGDKEMKAGLLNLDLKVISQWPSLKLEDQYTHNQVVIIGRNAYILGTSGHMHILDIDYRKFEELACANIYSSCCSPGCITV